MPSELERLRHYYIAARGGFVSDAAGVHPMQTMVPMKSSIRAPADDDAAGVHPMQTVVPMKSSIRAPAGDEADVRALLEELNETAFKRHRAHGRRLDLALSIRRKAQNVAVEAERGILEGYHRSQYPFMPVHVRERLNEIGHLLGPPSQDRYPRAAAAV